MAWVVQSYDDSGAQTRILERLTRGSLVSVECDSNAYIGSLSLGPDHWSVKKVDD